MEQISFFFEKADRRLEAKAILCGVGLSNAAAATAWLIADGVDGVINEGLSGALSGLHRGEAVLGERFYQYDFDATAFGYELGQMCDEPYPFEGDNLLYRYFSSRYAHLKRGVLASANRFVSSEETKRFLCEKFGAVACDMESSAVALVCHKQSIPFVVIREAADDAGEDAAEVYDQISGAVDGSVLSLVMDGVKGLLEYDAFFA